MTGKPSVLVADQAQVLGADADAEVLPGDARAGLAGQLDVPAAELRAALALHGQGHEVHRGGADEAGDEHVGRAVVHGARLVDLLQDAGLEDGDPVAHRHGLDLVVGDVDRRHAEAALQRRDLRAGGDAQLGVEVGQRLVHAEDLRVAHDRAAHGDALALPAGQRLGLAVEVVGEVEDLGRLLDPLVDLALVARRRS